jgi:hypothetical protein
MIGSHRLDFLGVQVLICRIGLDEATNLSLKRLEKVAVNVLAVAEGLVDFLETITVEDYGAFWAPCKFSTLYWTDNQGQIIIYPIPPLLSYKHA